MKFRFLALFLVLLIFAPIQSFACACCSEEGFYSIRTGKPDDYNIEVLEQIKFAQDPQLYLDEAGLDQITGLEIGASDTDDAEYWKFNLTNSFTQKIWKFNFKSFNKKSGTLVLPMPTQMVSFKADIHDGKKSGGGGPLLYKEWRFKGNVQSGNGFFQSGIVKPTTYFLVLQGRGNGCDNAEDFTDWRLEIDGKKSRFAFYGKLSSGSSMSTEDLTN